MKILLTTLLVAAAVMTAGAFDAHLLAKPAPVSAAPPVSIPEVQRQGGDTVADAVRIPIPTVDLAGTTTGYADDYDVQCPYGGHVAPDVVYSIVPEIDMMLDIDMCGSGYDTRIWVWDVALDWPLHCNDDFYNDPECGYYTSKIENVAVTAGVEYYIVVDGYGDAHGDYLIDVIPSLDCDISCPAGAVLEGEPPLQADYVDLHNGGCSIDMLDPPMQVLRGQQFCGTSGWYAVGDDAHGDRDWLTTAIPDGGVLEVTVEGYLDTTVFEVGPHDCYGVDVLQEVTSDGCTAATLTVAGEPGATVWLVVRPGRYGPWYMLIDAWEYEYVLTTNLAPVAVEDHSWTEVKSLFD